MNMTSLKKLDFCDTAELVEPKLVGKLSKEFLAHRHPPVNSLSIWAEISFGLLTLRVVVKMGGYQLMSCIVFDCRVSGPQIVR